MLTLDQIKAIETALGPEKAAPLLEAIQTTDTRVMSALLGEVATKEDMANLRTEISMLETRMEARFGSLETRIARLEIMLKLLIGLTALAVAFFSPVAEKLLTLL